MCKVPCMACFEAISRWFWPQHAFATPRWPLTGRTRWTKRCSSRHQKVEATTVPPSGPVSSRCWSAGTNACAWPMPAPIFFMCLSWHLQIKLPLSQAISTSVGRRSLASSPCSARLIYVAGRLQLEELGELLLHICTA